MRLQALAFILLAHLYSWWLIWRRLRRGVNLTTWCGSVVNTKDRHWTIWPLWAAGWLRLWSRKVGLPEW